MLRWKIWLIVILIMIPLVVLWVFSLSAKISFWQNSDGQKKQEANFEHLPSSWEKLLDDLKGIGRLWSSEQIGQERQLRQVKPEEIQQLREEVLKKITNNP